MTTSIRSGIPTTYRETRFRSRLEARWAAFFDLVDWPWTYEPVDADGYVPDFLIHGAHPIYVEVGPCVDRADLESKAAKARARADILRHDVLVVGVDVRLPIHSEHWGVTGELGVAGLLGEYMPATDACFDFDLGVWSTCQECGLTGVVHTVQSYAVRPCGHHPGGAIFGCETDVARLWRQAGTDTQWKR